MIKDYSSLLDNLHGRRYDEALRESIVSDAFDEYEYGDCVKYTLESMEEVEPSYTYKTFHIAKRIQDKLQRIFQKRKIAVDFRYQGPIQTESHIVLYGGVELIVATQANKEEKPWKTVYNLGQELQEILSKDRDYHDVVYQGKNKIVLKTSKPVCEVSILPCLWLDNASYLNTKREIDRGICEYHLAQKTLRRYLPFMNIARINAKDDKCNGGLKRTARLLRTLQRDAQRPIDLNNYEICSILYGIPEKQLTYDPKKALGLLGVVSAQFNRLIKNKEYRQKLISPSRKELVFGKKEYKAKEIYKLKKELDQLILDLKKELAKENKNLYSQIEYY